MLINPVELELFLTIFQNSSQNSNLLSGPDLFVFVLIKILQRKYIVMTDIKSTFHQVFVKPPDIDSPRFVWRGKRQDTEFAKLHAFASYMPLHFMYFRGLCAFAFYVNCTPDLRALLTYHTLFTKHTYATCAPYLGVLKRAQISC